MTATPSLRMRIRHERRGDGSASLIQMISGSASYEQIAALYDLAAVKGTKPVVVTAIDRAADLTSVEQGALVTVWGWPAVGRAVLLDIDGMIVEPAYPCTSPVIRSMRFK